MYQKLFATTKSIKVVGIVLSADVLAQLVLPIADDLAPLDASRFLFQRPTERIGVRQYGHRLPFLCLLQRLVVLLSKPK